MQEFRKRILWLYRYFHRVIPSFYYPYPLPGGMIYLDISESSKMLARVLRLYEPQKHCAMKSLLRPGDIFVDVGVNKGDFTLLASKIVGDDGKILAVEPEPINCHWIRKSIAVNQRTNIQLFEIALDERNGKAELYLAQKSGWHTLLPKQVNRDAGTTTVETRTLDDLCREMDVIDHVNMVKIDVEGAEMRVLHGSHKVLDSSRQITLLIDIHPALGVVPECLCDYLKKRGFSIFQERSPFTVPVRDFSKVSSVIARREV